MLELKILGVPMAKQSARFFAVGKKVRSFQKTEVVKRSENIAYDVKSQLPLNHVPIDTPIAINVLFVFPPPSTFSKKKMEELRGGKVFYKDTKPDLDNLCKLLWDAMQGIVFTNDSRIAVLTTKKIYGEIPRIEISITDAD